MHEIVLIEDGCCHPGELDDYRAFLQARVGTHATIIKLGVGGHLGFAAVPTDLGNKLLAQGASAVPLVAVDGQLVHNGKLPDWEDSLTAIERVLAQPLVAAQAS
jgi:hypothetical protein